MKNDKFFEENDRFADRHANTPKEVKKKKFALREMMWKAIDEGTWKDFSIVETSIALGLYERDENGKLRRLY